MRRRAVLVAVVVPGVLAVAPAGIADTGVSGQVESIMSLSLTRTAPDRVAATVSATVAPTRLSAGARVLGAYAEPVGRARATARGGGELTITYGLADVAAAGVGVATATASASAPAGGGLSLSPAVVEHDAQPGAVGALKVANGSSRPVAIRVRARPWIQARDGGVEEDGRRTLAAVQLGASAFTLAPGEARTIPATLLARPASGSLYGAIEVVGTPPRPAGGVRARYRLLGGLRLDPPSARRRLGVRAGAARADATGAVVAVRNTGNTVEPVTGSARITAAGGTLRGTVAARRILPGATVDLRLRRGRLRAGRYTAVITLRQGGRTVAAVTRAFRQG